MPPRQTSPHRGAARWGALLLGLLLPGSVALAQANTPQPEAAGSTPPERSPTRAAQEPDDGDGAAPAAADPVPASAEAAASAPEAAGAAAASPPPRTTRPGGPSRAPAATQDAGSPRRRWPTTAPAAPSGAAQTPLPRLGSSAPAGPWSQPEEDFGRWQRSTQQCEIQRQELRGKTPERQACRSVRLDQQLSGLLSIRFLPAARQQSGRDEQLLFAGILVPGSQPMRCQDSRCEPRWPMGVQLTAVATSNPGTLGLPQARVVQGRCTLEQSRMLCMAYDREGRRWQARALW